MLPTITCICGGRDFKPIQDHWNWLNYYYECNNIILNVSGDAIGADKFGEHFASTKNIPTKKFPIENYEWKLFSKTMGHVRNSVMSYYLRQLKYTNKVNVVVLAFPGGNGTKNMIKMAHTNGLGVNIFPYNINLNVLK